MARMAKDQEEGVVRGGDAYDGSQKQVEVKSNHSADYDGPYRSRGRFEREAKD